MTSVSDGPTRFGRHSVELTHTDKVLFPDSGITKGNLIDYYAKVADVMLPHLRDRPLTLERFPDGIDEEGFYQKKATESLPAWVRRATVTLEDGSRQDQVVANDVATLGLLAQRATVTMHVWLNRTDHLGAPDRMVVDLDPGESTSFATLRRTARELREMLEEIGLSAYPMLTGSTGLHVWVPLRANAAYDEVRDLARSVATTLAERRSDELTTEVRKEKREGRLFLDVARNAKGQTAVAPYSVRARPGAPVATPLDWDELSGVDESGRYTISSMLRRLAQRDDPWKDMARHAASLAKAASAWDRKRS